MREGETEGGTGKEVGMEQKRKNGLLEKEKVVVRKEEGIKT